MPLDTPGRAGIERLVEGEQMVADLGADKPFRGSDQVFGVGRIDADVGLRVTLDQHSSGGWRARIAARLGGVGSEILTACNCAVADRFTAVAGVGAIAHCVRYLRRVATGLLRGRKHVRYLRNTGG